jgi:AcrR family transcriptional regulator
VTAAAADCESHDPTPPEGLREKILEAARALVVEMTFENVRMRDLAARSGVALNTLYRYFPNKTSVLNDAVVEFFAKAYSDIAAPSFDHGIDKLVHILDGVAERSRSHSAFAKSLGPRLVSQYYVWSLGEIRFRSYLPAITQIREEGDLADHVEVKLLTSLICRQITAVYLS